MIYGRIHLPNIERDYKQKNVNGQETTAETAISAGERLKGEIKGKSIYPKHDDYKNIKIYRNGDISECQSTQNDIAAIATVDYAIKERKPTCGLGKGSKYRLVVNS